MARRMMRRLHYYGSRWWLQKFRSPRRLLYLSDLDRLPGITYNGFYICAYLREFDTPVFRYFAATIVQSLDLIARYDPRRYQTVVRNIRTIAWDSRLDSLGVYNRLFRLCVINYKGTFDERAGGADAAGTILEPSLNEVVWLASLLVHEATHGRVCSFFVPYDKRNREGIEKLCIKEEERFLNKLYHLGVYPKVTMKPFSADKWKKYWKD